MSETILKLTKVAQPAASNVLDIIISELNTENIVEIVNISDFFAYYDKVKSDLSQLEVSESHQYLVNEAIKETEGQIYIWPSYSYWDISGEQDIKFTWNDIKTFSIRMQEMKYQIDEQARANDILQNENFALLNIISNNDRTIASGSISSGQSFVFEYGGEVNENYIFDNQLETIITDTNSFHIISANFSFDPVRYATNYKLYWQEGLHTSSTSYNELLQSNWALAIDANEVDQFYSESIYDSSAAIKPWQLIDRNYFPNGITFAIVATGDSSSIDWEDNTPSHTIPKSIAFIDKASQPPIPPLGGKIDPWTLIPGAEI